MKNGIFSGALVALSLFYFRVIRVKNKKSITVMSQYLFRTKLLTGHQI